MPIGTATTSPLPAIFDVGPGWASAVNAALLELQQIVALKLGNASLNVTDADVKHGTRTAYYHASAGTPTGTSAFTGATSMFWQGAAAGDTVVIPIEQAINERVTAVSVYGRSAGVTAWTWKLWSVNLLTGSVSQISTTQTSGTAAAIEKKSITGLTQTIGSDTVIVAEWIAGASGNRVYGVEVQFDKVATP